jgi:hypothetical protein
MHPVWEILQRRCYAYVKAIVYLLCNFRKVDRGKRYPYSRAESRRSEEWQAQGWQQKRP